MIEKEVLRKNVKIALIPFYSSKKESVFVWQVTDRTVHTHKHTFHEKSWQEILNLSIANREYVKRRALLLLQISCVFLRCSISCALLLSIFEFNATADSLLKYI